MARICHVATSANTGRRRGHSSALSRVDRARRAAEEISASTYASLGDFHQKYHDLLSANDAEGEEETKSLTILEAFLAYLSNPVLALLRTALQEACKPRVWADLRWFDDQLPAKKNQHLRHRKDCPWRGSICALGLYALFGAQLLAPAFIGALRALAAACSEWAEAFEALQTVLRSGKGRARRAAPGKLQPHDMYLAAQSFKDQQANEAAEARNEARNEAGDEQNAADTDKGCEALQIRHREAELLPDLPQRLDRKLAIQQTFGNSAVHDRLDRGILASLIDERDGGSSEDGLYNGKQSHASEQSALDEREFSASVGHAGEESYGSEHLQQVLEPHGSGGGRYAGEQSRSSAQEQQNRVPQQQSEEPRILVRQQDIKRGQVGKAQRDVEPPQPDVKERQCAVHRQDVDDGSVPSPDQVDDSMETDIAFGGDLGVASSPPPSPSDSRFENAPSPSSPEVERGRGEAAGMEGALREGALQDSSHRSTFSSITIQTSSESISPLPVASLLRPLFLLPRMLIASPSPSPDKTRNGHSSEASSPLPSIIGRDSPKRKSCASECDHDIEELASFKRQKYSRSAHFEAMDDDARARLLPGRCVSGWAVASVLGALCPPEYYVVWPDFVDFEAPNGVTRATHFDGHLPNQKIVLPVNFRNSHWTLVIINVLSGQVKIYDPYPGGHWLERTKLVVARILASIQQTASFATWTFETAQPTPQQQQKNSDDCGVLLIVWAIHSTRGAKPGGIDANLWRWIFSVVLCDPESEQPPAPEKAHRLQAPIFGACDVTAPLSARLGACARNLELAKAYDNQRSEGAAALQTIADMVSDTLGRSPALSARKDTLERRMRGLETTLETYDVADPSDALDNALTTQWRDKLSQSRKEVAHIVWRTLSPKRTKGLQKALELFREAEQRYRDAQQVQARQELWQEYHKLHLELTAELAP